MLKKWIAIFLASTMLLGTFTLTAFATESEPNVVTLKYATQENGSKTNEFHLKGNNIFSYAWTQYFNNKDKKGSNKRNPGFLYGAFFCFNGSGIIPERNENEAYIVERNQKVSIFWDTKETPITIQIKGPFAVEEGGTLLLKSRDALSSPTTDKQQTTVICSAPIMVSGQLDIAVPETVLSKKICDIWEFQGEGKIQTKEGGNITIHPNMIIKGDNDNTPIFVNGGTVTITDTEWSIGDEPNVAPEIKSSNAPAIQVAAGELMIQGAVISSDAEAIDIGESSIITMERGTVTTGNPIEIPSNAKITLTEGKIATQTQNPAIKVASGAFIEFGDVEVQSNGKVAVELNGNSSVKMHGKTILVAGSDADESYIDNNGIMVLAAGATIDGRDDPMNAALVLNDGTIIQGSKSQAPTIEESGSITVPAGGLVTTPKGEEISMPGGGSVTPSGDGDGVTVTVNVESVGLNTDTLRLKVGDRAKLTATVNPDNATNQSVSWESNNQNVATVDNGVVTAQKVGTATITATAGDKTATCKVTVGYEAIFKNGDTVVDTKVSDNDGKVVMPAAPSRAGYSFRGWYDGHNLYAAGETVQISKDTTFVAQWSDNTPYYTITVKDAANGTVTCYAKSAAKGADVTLTVKADVGYQLDKLTVTDASGKTVAVEKVNNTTYTFVMPGSKVTVEAVFVPTTVEPSGLPFTDVSTSDWFYGAVKFVYENGLMDGVGNNLFAPNATLNRAMAVTILYRLEGAPAVTTDAGFNDVAAGTWYTDAVNWAAANNIVNGVEGNNFDPTGSLTREQMATVLYRYAQYKGADVSASGDISGFADSANVSSWAADAVKWAVGTGLVNGVEGNALAPQGTSTRAQAATVLMRFVG